MSAPGPDRLGAADLPHAATDRKSHPTTAPGKGTPMTAPSPNQPDPADPPHTRRHHHRPGRSAAITAPSPNQPAPPRTKAPHTLADSTTHPAGAPQ